MRTSILNILVLGLSEQEHDAFLSDLGRVDEAISLNKKPLSTIGLKHELVKQSVDAVFIKPKPESHLERLYPVLKHNNADCIVVEFIDSTSLVVTGSSGGELQSCRIVLDRTRSEFYLAIQFVLQYTRLKIDFRRCKSLLYLSENRSTRLVNSSGIAIAYLFRGKILYANIPFLALFKADSVGEIKRFPLLKLIDENEREVFANYLAEVKKSPHLSADLTLTLKRITGIPFNGRVNISPSVVGGNHCYQIWVQELSKSSKAEAIPVTKSMNIWDLPDERSEAIQVNPFDHIISPHSASRKETSVDVMLDALQHDELVKLRFRELHLQGKGTLSHVLVDLDVRPEEFKKINTLLGKMPEVTKNPMIYGHFWDRLLFRMVGDELLHENNPDRTYLVELGSGMVSDIETVMWLYKMLKQLHDKSIQLVLLVDAQIPMSRIPKTQKAIELLRSSGCQIALSHFSVDTTPLFLYRQVQPEAVFLDPEWLDVLKERQDGGMFLSRFVQQIEGRGVSVIIPHTIQKSKDRLLVLSAASFSQEKTTQGYV